MKNIKGLGIMGICLLGSVFVYAQNANSSLTVSKGVQQVANKKAFADENARGSQLEAKSVDFPVVVLSKGVTQSSETVAEGNMESNYPTWAVSKGVARKGMERSEENTEGIDSPIDGIIRNGEEISKN